MLLQLVFACLLVDIQGVTAHEINITHSNELETVLCQSGPFNYDTIIVLFPNITHEITNISFCLVNTSHSLTIKSATNSLAYIRCPTAVSHPSYPTSGFVFINLYNLTLQKLSFQECGALLRDLNDSILSSINSTTSPVYFTEYHSSLLLFLHIETLLIKEVNMLSNYGFSILANNPLNATIENVNVTSTKGIEFYQETNMSLGNGVLLLFTDENNVKSLQNNVSIKEAIFVNNFDYINSINCLSYLDNLVHQETFTSIPVVNAAGLTILYTQQNFSANVEISSTMFYHNYGSFSGAVLVLHFYSAIADSSIQVLVTVVHLSFISMFTAISNIVTPINIYTNDTNNPILKVWYGDGTVEYGRGIHLILMILIIVVVIPVLLSYFTIIAAGRPLMRVHKFREYIRPVYEAIHGPYEHNKEIFFTTRLLLLVFFYILYVMYRTKDIYKGYVIVIPVFAIYVIIEAFCRPFRKLWLKILDLFVMCNCVIVSGTLWYLVKVNKVSLVLTITATIVFLTLVTVITSHILWITGTLKKIKPKLYILQMKFSLFVGSEIHHNSRHRDLKTPDLEGSFLDTYDETREPLLSSI